MHQFLRLFLKLFLMSFPPISVKIKGQIRIRVICPDPEKYFEYGLSGSAKLTSVFLSKTGRTAPPLPLTQNQFLNSLVSSHYLYLEF